MKHLTLAILILAALAVMLFPGCATGADGRSRFDSGAAIGVLRGIADVADSAARERRQREGDGMP